MTLSKPVTVVKALLLYEENGAIYFLELIRSLKKVVSPGQGDLPGGKVDAGESLIKALMREIKEETGLEVDVLHKILSYDWIHGAQLYQEHLYYTTVNTQNIILSADEHDSYQWIPLTDVDTSSLHPAIKKIINTWVHKK